MSEEKSKSAFDERALDKLLEAAFVLQEHNRKSRAVAQQFEETRARIEMVDRSDAAKAGADRQTAQTAPQQGDYNVTLGKIVETQRQIQVRQLDLLNAMALVAERVVEVSGGSGAAIGIAEGQFVHYRAVAGKSAPSLDSTIPVDRALCSVSTKTGQVLRCADLNLEGEVDKDECTRRSIASFVAVPVFLQGNVTGALELYFASPQAFTEQDVHTCQLMAGLVTEALVRDEEATWKKSLASERAAMLEALEKLQPNLAALVDTPKHSQAVPVAAGVGGATTCDRCGHPLVAGEKFCGECGAPQNAMITADEPKASINIPVRLQEPELPSADMPGTLAPSELESGTVPIPTAETAQESYSEPEVSPDITEEENVDFAEMLRKLEDDESTPEATTNDERPHDEIDHQKPEITAIQKLTHPADWSSAAAAKDFLERLSAKNGAGSLAQFWSTRRGDIYLAISVILVICVVIWGMMNRSVGASGGKGPATATHAKAPDMNLSLFDRILIRLGLADEPTPAEDKGNPATQVWVDQRTALYYCPGSDLYEKTPKGKFMSQRDAQLDQFEPAYRKPCN